MFRKKYCCSNRPKTVATILALIDIHFGSIFSILFICLTHLVINYPECLRTIVATNPAKQQDLHMILTWGPWKQAFMLSVPLISSLSNLCMGILLLVGSRKENLKLVKTWFFLHITFCTLSVIFFVPEVIFTQDKALIIFLSLINYVYDFYSLWIIKCFISELHFKKVSRGTKHSPRPISTDADVEAATAGGSGGGGGGDGGEVSIEFTDRTEKF